MNIINCDINVAIIYGLALDFNVNLSVKKT